MPAQNPSSSLKQQRIITSGNFTSAEMTDDGAGRMFFQVKDLNFEGIDQIILWVQNNATVTLSTSGDISLGSDLFFKGAGQKTVFANGTWAVSSATGNGRINIFQWIADSGKNPTDFLSPYSLIPFDDYSVLSAGGGNQNFISTAINTELPWLPNKCDILFRQISTQVNIDLDYIVYGIFGVGA